MTFTPNASDDWVILGFAELKNSSASYQTKVQITVDGAVAQDTSIAPKNNTDYLSFMGAKLMTLSAASHTFNVDYATSNASGTAYARNVRIVALRKSGLEWWSADEGDAGHDLTTTMTSYVSTNWTPAAGGDYLLIGSAAFNGNTTSYATTLNLMFNGTSLDDCTVTCANAANWHTFMFFKTAWADAGVQQTLGISAAKASGSSAVHHMKRGRVIAIRLTDGRYSGFQYVRSATEQTTTSTAWVQAGTKSFTATAGNWLFVATWRNRATNLSYSVEAQQQLDNTATEANPMMRPQATSDYMNAGCIDVRNLAAGTRVVDVDFRSKNASGSAKIKDIFWVGLPL